MSDSLLSLSKIELIRRLDAAYERINLTYTERNKVVALAAELALACGLEAGLGRDWLAEEGWQHVRPFVKTHGVNYPILMGDDKTFKAYKLDALPVTLLLDKQGRIAATYVGIVDTNNIEENIQLLARER